jgi:predicted Rossmann-fold nucleotide-binding protein
MQAANEGAASAPERAQSVGIRIDLPFEQEVMRLFPRVE